MSPLALEKNFSFVGLMNSRYALDQGRFARGVVTYQPEHFTGKQVQANIVDGCQTAKPLNQMLNGEHYFHKPSEAAPLTSEVEGYQGRLGTGAGWAMRPRYCGTKTLLKVRTNPRRPMSVLRLRFSFVRALIN
jgi:hypothetical protein